MANGLIMAVFPEFLLRIATSDMIFVSPAETSDLHTEFYGVKPEMSAGQVLSFLANPGRTKRNEGDLKSLSISSPSWPFHLQAIDTPFSLHHPQNRSK